MFKRGDSLDGGVYNWASILVLVVVLTVFTVIGSPSQAVAQDVNELEVASDDALLLINLLKAKTEDVLVLDLINLWYYDQKNYDSILEKELDSLLDQLPVPCEDGKWNLKIYLMPEEKEIFQRLRYVVIDVHEKRSVFMFLPLIGEEKYLKVELWSLKYG